MGVYKNEYRKEEDYMMWELHEIRNKLAKEKKRMEDINKNAEGIIKKYNLSNLKILKIT